MTDYAALIDAETWAFIERTNSHYPPDAANLTIAEQRAVYDEMARAFFAGYPDGVTAETTAIGLADRDIPIRIYRTAAPEATAMVLYFHGGGFMLGGLSSHDDVCAELCAGTGYEIVSVDYRLAPEQLHPACLDDAVAAFEWAATTTKRAIVLCGDSAGGNLAAAVSHKVRGHARAPVGQVLIYPLLGKDRSGSSYREHTDAPMLTVRDLDYYGGISGAASDDVSRYPLLDTGFGGLPPTVVVTAQCDPLSSDGDTYRDRIVAAGGKAWWYEEPGLVHGYLRARHTVERARAAFSRIVEAVAALGHGAWPY